jgi:hypothetical protein
LGATVKAVGSELPDGAALGDGVAASLGAALAAALAAGVAVGSDEGPAEADWLESGPPAPRHAASRRTTAIVIGRCRRFIGSPCCHVADEP